MTKKTMFGIAAALTLGVSPAWAGDEKSEDDRAADGDTVAMTESSLGESDSESGTGSASEHTSGARASESSVRAFDPKRWLVEREGYRDGGY